MEKKKKITKNKISQNNIGNSGEYYIASLLSAKNCIVSVTLGRGEGFDLMVVKPDKTMVKLQIKTTIINRFIFSEKAEKSVSDDLFYIFVSIKDFANIDYWVFPSKELAKYSKIRYKKQMDIGYKETTIRNLTIKPDKFDLENWEEILKSYYKNIDLILKAEDKKMSRKKEFKEY